MIHFCGDLFRLSRRLSPTFRNPGVGRGVPAAPLIAAKGRLGFEEKTLRAMIAIYCTRRHSQVGALCPECEALERYALHRLEHCAFGSQKPTCAACVVHCYEPGMREKVRAVMRFAGPLMLKYHPVLALAHLIRRLRRQEPKLRRTGT